MTNNKSHVGRPEKDVVDYFQHDCLPKKTLSIIEEKYGNNGYSFWFKLLEQLGQTPGHYYDLNNSMNMEFLAARTKLTEEKCIEILNLLCRLEAIDCFLWKKKIVWVQNFVTRLSHLYGKRVKEVPLKPDLQLVKRLQNNGKKVIHTKKR